MAHLGLGFWVLGRLGSLYWDEFELMTLPHGLGFRV